MFLNSQIQRTWNIQYYYNPTVEETSTSNSLSHMHYFYHNFSLLCSTQKWKSWRFGKHDGE